MNRSSSRTLLLALSLALLWPPAARAAGNPHLVVYEGDRGPGSGKHIVFLAGDHEYRSEETLPALARILARRYGFRCSVFFTIDPATGFIQPGSSHIRGLEALESADLLVVFLRFQDFPDDEMQHIADYLEAGKPVIGLRTATHAFKIPKGKRFHAWSDDYRGQDFFGGFGRQILGEHWVGHYGRNHRQSSRLILEKEQLEHPVLRGVRKVRVQSGGYRADPIEGSVVLARGQILNGMTASAEPDPSKELLPVAWVREYSAPRSGKKGRVFTTTHGASEDLLDPGFRRLLVNACLWCAGLVGAILPDGPIDLVGPYHPKTFGFGGHRKGVKPSDIAGWDSPILGGGAGRARLFILSGQSNMAGLDPGISFTPAVRKAFAGDEVIVVKSAQGGQPIRRWYKKWKPAGGGGPAATGDLYDAMLEKVREAAGGGDLARDFASVAFVWMQGERDAREKYGDVYAQSLAGLVAQLEADLGRTDIRVVIGRLSDFDNENRRYPHWTRVRDAQVELAGRSSRYGWVDTDDLNGERNALHYTKEGYRELGARFASKAIELLGEGRE